MGCVLLPPTPTRAIRSREMVAVLGSVLEGSQLGHVWEVLLSRPRRRQDGEQPLEVVGEHLGRTECRDTAWGQRMLEEGDRAVAPGELGGVAQPGCSGR